jgi:glyoxylase-like metal-dependent hydrolase (beta-lactamase superfamily II)
MTSPTKLGERLFVIDTMDLGLPERTGCYVLIENEGVTLIETAASPSKPFIEKGLKALNLGLQDINRIILTHIHLDHAGGAGLFASENTKLKIFVHPKGIRHLADPTRLIEGAKAVYGERFDPFFAPVLPIPPEQMEALNHGEQLLLSADRTLTFLDHPGHAKHHYGIFDSLTKGMFVGDTVGIHYKTLEDMGHPLFLPSTSPNQFDPGAMRASMASIQSFHPERLYFGHYSMSEEVEEAYKQVSMWLDLFLEAGETVIKKKGDHTSLVQALSDLVFTRSEASRLPDGHAERQMIEVDLQVSAMGLLDYFHRKSSRSHGIA